MITSTDKEYIETKLIKQGKREIKKEFETLVNWINQTYGVNTLNIIYHPIETAVHRPQDKPRPRLEVCFEYENEKQLFISNRYDLEKQKAIADKFRNILHEKGLSESGNRKYITKNIWIFYAAFEPIARREANGLIPEEKILKLKQKLNIKEIWKIFRLFSETTFFFYTNKEIEEFSKKGIEKYLSSVYFDLIKKYDEFDYIKKESFKIKLDSKENFDDNYESSWFYYTR